MKFVLLLFVMYCLVYTENCVDALDILITIVFATIQSRISLLKKGCYVLSQNAIVIGNKRHDQRPENERPLERTPHRIK